MNKNISTISKITLLLSFFSLLFYGCAEHQTKKLMKDFMRAEIVLPEDLHSVENRNMSTESVFPEIPTLIIYHDSLECSTCRISHLMDYSGLYEMADTSGFQVVTVFSPRQEEYDEVLRQLMVHNFPYPIYIDFNCSFRNRNTAIPEDPRFHSFLIDKDRHPVFVGNPTASDDLWKVFEKTLAKID